MFCLGYLAFLIQTYWEVSPMEAYISYFFITVTYSQFLSTMFGDCGVPSSVYQHYYKVQFGSKMDAPTPPDSVISDQGAISRKEGDEEADLEATHNRKKKRGPRVFNPH
mmetsp:Transcript_6970/g.11178  ORF Transcript_6970/g.11178 Transcript_6970/m.11178 type:complete len:109 (-) Transcript_6970:136-462(-)